MDLESNRLYLKQEILILLENVIYDMSYIKYGVNIFLNMISHIFISSQLRSAWYLPVSQLVPSYPLAQLHLYVSG